MTVHGTPTYGELLRRATARHPDRVALTDEAGAMSYTDLRVGIGRVQAALREHGIRPGDRLAHLARNRAESYLVAAATYAMGATYVPLHPLGSVADFEHIVRDAGCRLVVVQGDGFEDALRDLTALLRNEVAVVAERDRSGGGVLDIADTLDTAPTWVTDTGAHPPRIAYTGGTTGPPKGVVQSHRSLVANALMTMAEIEWPSPPIFFTTTPMSHALGYFVTPILLCGGTIHLGDRFEPGAFCAAVERHGVTASFLVPTMLYRLLDDPATRDHALSTLELVIYGAAPTATARLQEAMARFGPIFQQSYGLTESPNCIATLRRGDHTGDPRLLESCGAPYAGVEVGLLGEDGERVPPGGVGELCVRSPLVMDGYWNRPEETARAFAGGWLHTGDLAREDDNGYLFLVGRTNDLIISGGVNVYAREVEDALATHPAVAQSAVLGLPDPVWGEAVTAFVVVRTGAVVEATDLIAHVRERKGSPHAPKALVVVPEIPVTALGKPDKQALCERVASEGGGPAVSP